VPMEKIREAKEGLRKVAADLSAEVRQSFSSNNKLSDEDRDAILRVIGKALVPFQSESVPEPQGKP
jgi:hypothetical protein